MSVNETIRSQADYLDALAAAIRTVNGRLDSLTRTDLEARLGVGGPVHTGLGPVPSALFGQSGPAATLGNVQPFVGQTNLLSDPTMHSVKTWVSSTNLTSTYQWLSAALTPAWFRAKFTGPSAGVPQAGNGFFERTIDSGDNAFNSDSFSLLFAPGATLGTYELHFASDQVRIDNIPEYPYLVGAIRLASLFSGWNYTGYSSFIAYLELTRGDLGAGTETVLASAAYDLRVLLPNTNRAQVQLVVAAPYVPSASGDSLRLRLVGVTTQATPSLPQIHIGEPAMHLAYTPDPMPFVPQLGAYLPEYIVGHSYGLVGAAIVQSWVHGLSFRTFDLSPAGDLRWGGGSADVDVRLRRSATKELSIDDGAAAGPVTTRLVGGRVAVPKAAQTVVAGTAIVADYEVVQINSAGNVTMTAAPTIANGVDGQMLTILNVDTADTITLQDQGTLASSNLRLAAATVALAPRQSIQLMYSATVGDWVQIGTLVSVL